MDIQKIAFILEIFGFVLAGIEIFNKPLTRKIESFFDELHILGKSFLEVMRTIILFVAMFIVPFVLWGITDYSIENGEFPILPALYDLFGVPLVFAITAVLAAIIVSLLKFISKSLNILGNGHAVGGVGILMACLGLLIESTQTFLSSGLLIWFSAIFMVVVIALIGTYYERKKS